MKYARMACFAMTVATVMTACSRENPASRSPAVTTTPSAEEKPVFTEKEPLIVDPASISEQNPAVLASAAWTKRQCAVATPADGIELHAAVAGGATEIAGYFIAPDNAPAGAFDLVLKGESRNFHIPARTGWDRSDVAEYFNAPALASSGYRISVKLKPEVPAGAYELDLMLDRSGTKYFCESGKILIVE